MGKGAKVRRNEARHGAVDTHVGVRVDMARPHAAAVRAHDHSCFANMPYGYKCRVCGKRPVFNKHCVWVMQ